MPAVDPALEMTAGDLFWQDHGRKVIVALVALVVLITGAGVWFWNSARLRASAESLYSSATGPDGWREVIEKYTGSLAAGNASLELASSLRAGGNLDGAVAELERFVSSQPDHPLAAAGVLALGELRRAQGKTDAALEEFRTVSSKYKDSYAAPLAMLAEAEILSVKNGGQGEARAVLESIGSLYPGTPAAMMAGAQLSRLLPAAQPPLAAPPAPAAP